eukprot:319486-Chlamydomonas_euryale.AAC.1
MIRHGAMTYPGMAPADMQASMCVSRTSPRLHVHFEELEFVSGSPASGFDSSCVSAYPQRVFFLGCKTMWAGGRKAIGVGVDVGVSVGVGVGVGDAGAGAYTHLRASSAVVFATFFGRMMSCGTVYGVLCVADILLGSNNNWSWLVDRQPADVRYNTSHVPGRDQKRCCFKSNAMRQKRYQTLNVLPGAVRQSLQLAGKQLTSQL